MATINITVKVINMEFKPGMATPGSADFLSFAAHFKRQMNIFYADVPGYQHVTVIQLSKGSIKVDHEVVLQVSFSEFKAFYAAAMRRIEEKLHSTAPTICSSEDKGDLCFKSNDSLVTPVPLSLEDLSKVCKKDSVITQQLQPYYVARNVSNQLKCVSNCSFLHPEPFRCEQGSCYIKPNGPNCYCEQSDAYWYTGRHCDQGISKVGVAVGVALGLAVLVLLILILAALLCWQRCCPQKDRRRLRSDPNEEKWYENESDWVARPQGFAPQSPEAQHQVPDPSASAGGEDARSASEQGGFQPWLDKVDTSLQARIARPRITQL
ncbi:mucin-3A-like [Candoia aspera]|uniref:mucin-3A-like n=1 Tax=Candoia aspera TaxID=51853 RepID=UPI002FD8252D